MSEYQYYEFLAVDRPLDDVQQAEVRALSTRARITATSFTNEYHWGDFRGDPRRLMERYYDAHLYLANWGTHRVMLRLPQSLLALDIAEQYCGEHMAAWTSREYLILDMTSEDEMGEWVEDDEDALSAIVGIRTELASGDLRPLYLAWLSAYRMEDEDAFEYEDDGELEPPVPPGLGSLSAPQRALADFLRLDSDLLTIAAEASPPMPTVKDDSSGLADWITSLSSQEKDELLVRVVQDQTAQVRMELLRRFRGDPDLRSDNRPRRTVAELLDAAAERRQEHRHRAEAARAAEMARREHERALARENRLEALADDQDAIWSRIYRLISARKPSDYDTAVDLLKDLRTLAQRADRTEEFARRLTLMRQEHYRKPTLIERFDRAGLTDPATTR